MMGRAPEANDLIVPLPPSATARRRTREGEPFRGYDYSGKRWRDEDLPALRWRHRRHYDMRATFITLALEDGADADVIEQRVTHTRKSRNAFAGYVRGQHWERTCAEVAKLNVHRREPGEVVALPVAAAATIAPRNPGADLVQSAKSRETTAGKSWRRRESKTHDTHLKTSPCCALNNLCTARFRRVRLHSARSGRGWAEHRLKHRHRVRGDPRCGVGSRIAAAACPRSSTVLPEPPTCLVTSPASRSAACRT
jgi:hypothetical protein